MNYVRTTNDDLRDHFFDHPVLAHWTHISGFC